MWECADISSRSFDEFVAFLFDREIPPESFASLAQRGETEKWQPWYDDIEVTFDAVRACEYYVQMFRTPSFLLRRFSKAQLEQGFWAIQSQTLECLAHRIIWNTDLPFAMREECVKAMLFLFKDLFALEPLDNAVSMWWDSFCYDWHYGNRKRELLGEDSAMQDVMFETLTEILALPSEICQGAAIHGLSHLHHPATGEVIRKYLEQHPALTEEWRDAALGAARFDLM